MNKRHNRRNQDVYDAETGSCASAVGVQETGTDGHTTKYTAQRYLTTVFDIHGDALEYMIFAANTITNTGLDWQCIGTTSFIPHIRTPKWVGEKSFDYRFIMVRKAAIMPAIAVTVHSILPVCGRVRTSNSECLTASPSAGKSKPISSSASRFAIRQSVQIAQKPSSVLSRRAARLVWDSGGMIWD